MPIISIPKPCQQKWEEFETRNEGRFCEQCQHVIVDFSRMTDAELLQYIKANDGITCGRFSNAQLDRPIQPLPKSTQRQRFQKVAATFFAVLSLRSVQSKADNLQAENRTVLEWFERENTPSNESVFIVKGKVVDEKRQPISGASVKLDSLHITTDSIGLFEFEIAAVDAKPMLLSVSYANLIPVTLNFHPGMGSTNYDVLLVERKGYGGYSMGIPAPFWNSIETSAIHFAKGYTLTRDQQVCLGKLADELKSNPGTPPLNIVGYARTAEEKKLAEKRIQQVFDFMIKKGIHSDRLKKVLDDTTSQNQLDFVFDF